jgi:hypothetical protein
MIVDVSNVMTKIGFLCGLNIGNTWANSVRVVTSEQSMTFSIQKGDRFWKSTPQYKKIVIEVVDRQGYMTNLIPCIVLESERNPVITDAQQWNIGTTYMLHPDVLEVRWERIPGKSDAFRNIYDILNGD